MTLIIEERTILFQEILAPAAKPVAIVPAIGASVTIVNVPMRDHSGHRVRRSLECHDVARALLETESDV